MVVEPRTDLPTVLVVEDEWLIAEALSRAVRKLGYRALGPVGSVADALAALDAETPDAVLLDTILGHESSVAVADRLLEEATPFAFFTGYSQDDLPRRFKGCRVLTKPVSEASLKAELKTLIT